MFDFEWRLGRHFLFLALLLAVCLPWVIWSQSPPINSLINEVISSIGWGGLVIAIFISSKSVSLKAFERRIILAPLVGILLLALIGIFHMGLGHFPYPSVLLIFLMYLLGAATVYWGGVRWASDPQRMLCLLEIFAALWVLSALVNVGLGLFQYFHPEGFYPWIAALQEAGRVYGNTRQPNHYATLMVIGVGCVLWLMFERRRIAPLVGFALIFCMILGVSISGSRTGMVALIAVSFAVLAFKWSVVRVKLSVLIALSLPLALGFFYVGLFFLDEMGYRPHFGSERLQNLQGDWSGSRFSAWSTAWEMIIQNAWFGVGVGRFQFNYLLGDWSSQQGQQFGHAHNLFLHLAAEHGLVVSSVVCCAFLIYGGLMLKRSWGRPETSLVVMVVGPILIHSFFEFPLWYVYFLFPFFFMLGILSVGALKESDEGNEVKRAGKTMGLLGAMMVVSPLLIWWSQRAGEPMYLTAETPISERIKFAQDSFLFRHYADHALLVTSPPEIAYSLESEPVYLAVAQVLFDERLAFHWSIQSLANGEIERAKRLAYALAVMNPEKFDELKDVVQRASSNGVDGAAGFYDYLLNPVRTEFANKDFR